MSGLQIMTNAIIMGICFAVGYMLKKSEKVKDNYIPIIMVTLGGVLGEVALFIGMADFIGTNILDSLWVGMCSGLVAVGIDQVPKQIKKLKEEGGDNATV